MLSRVGRKLAVKVGVRGNYNAVALGLQLTAKVLVGDFKKD